MTVPLQIVFRDMSPSESIASKIRDRVVWLEKYCDLMTRCRVVLEIPHRHHRKGNLYQVRVDLRVPGKELVVSRSPDQHAAHQDLHVLVHDVFDEVRRELEDYVRRRRREVKTHVRPKVIARVSEIVRYAEASQGYGFLRDELGRELYFNSRSVLSGAFDNLQVGDEVRFSEEMGDKGPQASSVQKVRDAVRFSHDPLIFSA